MTPLLDPKVTSSGEISTRTKTDADVRQSLQSAPCVPMILRIANATISHTVDNVDEVFALHKGEVLSEWPRLVMLEIRKTALLNLGKVNTTWLAVMHP